MSLLSMGSNQHGYFHGTEAFPPYLPRIYKTPPRSSYSGSSSASFPILAIAILGIISTAFLLICYYVFVIKCCLNWHRFNLLRRFASSRRLRHEDSLIVYSTTIEARGLDESAIRSIPILKFKREVEDGDPKMVHECAVCLNEFQDGEKLRLLPRCAHAFHIDCIDTWLQSNANCPLCRSSISSTGSFNQTLSHNPSQEPHQSDTNLGEPVVIEVGDHGINQTPRNQDLGGSGSFEFSIQMQSRRTHQSQSPRKLGPRTLSRKQRRFHHVSSMGDECIDVREKDEQFCVEPIRRSFSMDSSADRQLYLTVQEALRQNPTIHELGSSNEGSSSRIQRSFFSFGHGRGSRNAVIPVDFDA